jgi:hypothetical protein
MTMFTVGEILTVMHDRMVTDSFVGIHKLAEHLAGEPVWTHQLPRVWSESQPWLREQFPDLAAVDIPDSPESDAMSKDDWRTWLTEIERCHGSSRVVQPMPKQDHTSVDPISEWRMMRPDAPIIAVQVDEKP